MELGGPAEPGQALYFTIDGESKEIDEQGPVCIQVELMRLVAGPR